MTVEELRGCPLFRDIAPEDLQAMLGCLSAREAAPRRYILSDIKKSFLNF